MTRRVVAKEWMKEEREEWRKKDSERGMEKER